MDLKRFLRHTFRPPWLIRRSFPGTVLDAIEKAVGEAERNHRGEIRLAVEDSLPPHALWVGQTPRERAIEVFSMLRVWDTELNTGVLVYLLLADRNVEVVADRGINARVSAGEWERVCALMEAAYREGRFEQGSLEGIRAIAELLIRHFPRPEVNPNELPNRPVVL